MCGRCNGMRGKGRGLNTYINKYVRENYARRLA